MHSNLFMFDLVWVHSRAALTPSVFSPGCPGAFTCIGAFGFCIIRPIIRWAIVGAFMCAFTPNVILFMRLVLESVSPSPEATPREFSSVGVFIWCINTQC